MLTGREPLVGPIRESLESRREPEAPMVGHRPQLGADFPAAPTPGLTDPAVKHLKEGRRVVQS